MKVSPKFIYIVASPPARIKSYIEARHHEACDKLRAPELKVTWPAVAGKRRAEVMGGLRDKTESVGEGQGGAARCRRHDVRSVPRSVLNLTLSWC